MLIKLEETNIFAAEFRGISVGRVSNICRVSEVDYES